MKSGTGTGWNNDNQSRTATVVVAATNSSTKSKQGADYICDGTADDVEINAAITSIATTGGKVLLLEGTFNVASSINITTSNIVLEGQGHGTILKLSNGANTSVIHVGNGGISYIQSIFIQKLQIDGNKTNQTGASHGVFFDRMCYYSYIKDLYITNTLTDAINIYATSEPVDGCYCNEITGCQIFYPGRDGIHIENSHEVNIANCPTISNAGANGIYESQSNSFRISNVRISVAANYGLDLEQSSNGQIDKLNIVSTVRGLSMNGSINNYLSKCVFESSSYAGVVLVASSFNVISESLFPYSQNYLLFLGSASNRNVIRDNYFGNASKSGNGAYSSVKLANGSSYNLFAGNVFDLTSHSVSAYPKYAIEELDTSDYNTIENNMITPTNFVTGLISIIGANTSIKRNRGYTTETKGTATVASGSTSIVVTHGLSKTPNIQDIIVTPTNNPTNAVKYWVSNITSTQFTINTSTDPGTSTATFAWQIN